MIVPEDGTERLPVEAWRERSEEAEKRGDYLEACDAALLGLEQHPESRDLQYRSILNLSRSGARRRAAQLWQKYELENLTKDAAVDAKLAGNIASLGARLDREEAFAAPPENRSPKLRAAAERYEAIYGRTGNTFPGINAAVLYQLGGQGEKASGLAAKVIEDCRRSNPRNDEDAYQIEADRAAASMVLRDERAVQRAVDAATALGGKASGLASTRRQLLLLCENMGVDAAILAPLKNRSVVYYTGSPPTMAAGPGVGNAIRAQIRTRRVGYGYGSLGSDGEVAVAEALLESGCEAAVVLPFETEHFLAANEPAKRFVASVGNGPDAARLKISSANQGAFLADDQLLRYATRLAMGLAILHAETLCTDVVRLRIGGAEAPDMQDETQRLWDKRGLPTAYIASDGPSPCSDPAALPDSAAPQRRTRFVIFGDFEHFSRLKDAEMLIFYQKIMGRVARTLERYEEHLLVRNTWGDGLHLVFDDIGSAARCALSIQADLATLDLAAVGLPPTLGLRLALDAGAVFEVTDPILRALAFTGSHVCRSARLEPGTPPGEVYVTETFAALLSLSQERSLGCDYVGSMPAAKKYGRIRTYLLRSA